MGRRIRHINSTGRAREESNNKLNVLITGGCGFIGINLIKCLCRRGDYSIRVLDNLSVGTRESLASVAPLTEQTTPEKSNVELIVGDIIDEQLALQVAKGMDVIVHLAANTGVAPSVENPRLDCMTNVIGTLNYLEAARQNKIKRFIFASSGAPMGECEPPIHEELAPNPVSPYGASKLAGEGYCSAYFHTFGVETAALRFGNVYGPGSGHKSSAIAKFIRQAIQGETIEIYGDGTQTRDFIYIDDLIQAIHLVMAAEGIGGEVFQIATSAETTIGELVRKLLPILNEVGFDNIQVRYTSPRVGDVKRNFSDTSKAKKMLGWQAEVELGEGLAHTVAWFVD
jgi:UDP-glucose 4-epimerase